MQVHLIGGSGSCGITMLAGLLEGLDPLLLGPESGAFAVPEAYGTEENAGKYVYRYGHQARKYEGWPLEAMNILHHDQFYHAIKGRFTDAPSMYDVADKMRVVADSHKFAPRAVWVDRTAKNAYAAKEFLDTFRTGKFVHIIRDGRAVAWSLAQRYRASSPGRSMADCLEMGATRWVSSVRLAKRAMPSPRYRDYRYEHICRHPKTQLAAIYKFLSGRDIVPRRQRMASSRYRAEFFASIATWRCRPSAVPDPRNIDAWQDEMRGSELAALMKAPKFAETLEITGYA